MFSEARQKTMNDMSENWPMTLAEVMLLCFAVREMDFCLWGGCYKILVCRAEDELLFWGWEL